MAEIPYLDAQRRRTRTVKNVSDLLRFLEGGGGDHYLTIFRGHRRDWPLLPKVARGILMGGTEEEVEELILDAFRREAVPHLAAPPEDVWEWLAIGQHHGLPTRLLDWTKNPLVALWFAVALPTSPDDGPGVLWGFQPHHRDLLQNRSDESPFSGDAIRVFEPRHVSHRIRAQGGLFTVHKRVSGKIPALQDLSEQREHLLKCVIPPERFATIRYQLMDCGVHDATLFPDLDGVARRITTAFTMPDDMGRM